MVSQGLTGLGICLATLKGDLVASFLKGLYPAQPFAGQPGLQTEPERSPQHSRLADQQE